MLKKRIFLSDRFEKIEKVLMDMKMIFKEVHYCSPQDFAYFVQIFAEIKPDFISRVQEDTEDLWFEIYKSVAADKTMVEKNLELEVQKIQRRDHKRLAKKRRRLQSLKDSFDQRAAELNKLTKAGRRELRRYSAPCHLNFYAEETR